MAKKMIKEQIFHYDAKDKNGKSVSGDITALTKEDASRILQRRGLSQVKAKKKRSTGGKAITLVDIAVFTRQWGTMMRSGVPLLQSFDIVAKGHDNPSMTRLLLDIKRDVESGSTLSESFSKHPKYFTSLYCNLIAAGEQAGILETMLDSLATYMEKTLAIKKKVKSAMVYPVSIIVVAFAITAVIMIYVIPQFKSMFESFGSNLPTPTLIVMQMSDFFVEYWWAIFGSIGGTVFGLSKFIKSSVQAQRVVDKIMLKVPIFGNVLLKSAIARWCRTLATTYKAGVPLVQAFDTVAGASGSFVYEDATKVIQREVAGGTPVYVAMEASKLFPNMAVQMCQIGEESGAMDTMLEKVAEFYEDEVDNAVAALSSLMEPLIMVVLGVLIGGIVVAMYLPIFKMGSVA